MYTYMYIHAHTHIMERHPFVIVVVLDLRASSTIIACTRHSSSSLAGVRRSIKYSALHDLYLDLQSTMRVHDPFALGFMPFLLILPAVDRAYLGLL